MPRILGYVVVDADGTILHSSGLDHVDHPSQGQYDTTFTFSVANACEIASICQSDRISAFITTFGGVVNQNVVRVITSTPAGERRDYAFQLLVVE
ncbi:hypothetical protein KSD_72350 [Ktedonobacter sp. SOSP1-85]|uniref:hypothetical protein n=1 Tax=Ktedonobacter sp. SOSP1-85 TaxID=2778367 RepID=UPI001915C67A|nr:hypothetical protein [Ktedonobacter sp. SOSP1-85]GHO79464.1 hypothetical protein KSD_72350 [Ktedonobacter sp. SOSP1-85]